MCVSGNNRILFYPSGQNTAVYVYGQANSWTSSSSSGGAGGLGGPAALALDAQGNLYAADFNNHRVLVYPAPVAGGAAAASTTAGVVYGQADFASISSNKGSSTNTPSASSMWRPAGLVVDGSGNLYVADGANNRVLNFPVGQTNGAQAATRVYGQF